MSPNQFVGPAGQARLAAAVWAGRGAARASRIAGRGSGGSIQGQVMLALDPGALTKLLTNKRVALVSGTNGKTTTTHFLAAAVRAHLGLETGRLVHNADGANLCRGIASALSEHRGADTAVLETDERVVGQVIAAGQPEVLVLLNLSRDQLDRHHEIAGLARSWRDALRMAGPHGPIVVANTSEPLIVWVAQQARQVVWVDAATNWAQDSIWCPNCGSSLSSGHPDGSIGFGGGWHCAGCGLAQPRGHYVVANGQIMDRQGNAWEPGLSVPGDFNVSNAACALAAAELLGVPPLTALEAMRRVSAPAGRFATTRIGRTSVRLLLAKNPAGWAETLPLAQTATVVLAVDSAAADGRDVSWLWDVDFEQLAGRLVITAGARAQDLAVRLSHAQVQHLCVPALADALAGLVGPVDVIATYTPFQKLRKLGNV